MKQKHLFKHSAAIHISSSISTNERKIFNICLRNAFPELMINRNFSIPIKIIKEELGWSDNSETNDLIKKSIKNLVSTAVEWNIFGKDRSTSWGVFTLLCSARICKGILTYTYTDEIRELLGQPNIYARLNLSIQKKISSKHALVLWEFLIDIASLDKRILIETEKYSLEKIKKLLGLDCNEYYSDFKRFNEKILSPSCKEVSKYSEIDVNYSLIKENRKVKSIIFFIKKKKINIIESVEHIEDELPLKTISSELNRLCLEIGISEKFISDILNEYSLDKIIFNIKYIQSNIDVKKIRNIEAYLSALLKKDSYLTNGTEIIEFEKLNNETDSLIESFKENSFLANIICQELGKKVFLSWFKNVKIKKENKEVILIFLNGFSLEYVKKKFGSKIINILQNKLGENFSIIFSMI